MRPNDPVLKIMTPAVDLVTVKMDETMARIRTIFEKNTFHHIPVLDNGKLIGIISKTDFLRFSYMVSYSATGRTEVGFESNYLSAKDIMTKFPVFVEPEDSIGLVADIFLANRFHSMPVLDDDELVGIVTSHDLLHFAFKSPVELETVE